MFKPLTRKEIRKIVGIQFTEIQQMLRNNGIELIATNEVLDYLSEIGFDPQFGARPLKRVLQKRIMNDLSKEILKGAIEKDSVVGIELGEGNEIIFNNVVREEV
jgi:ATP-dependent Clp protease ATP-binding subunit ClpB